MQAACKKFEADISDLKNRLKMQEMETRKANAKFVSSIAAQEKLKTEFGICLPGLHLLHLQPVLEIREVSLKLLASSLHKFPGYGMNSYYANLKSQAFSKQRHLALGG